MNRTLRSTRPIKPVLTEPISLSSSENESLDKALEEDVRVDVMGEENVSNEQVHSNERESGVIASKGKKAEIDSGAIDSDVSGDVEEPASLDLEAKDSSDSNSGASARDNGSGSGDSDVSDDSDSDSSTKKQKEEREVWADLSDSVVQIVTPTPRNRVAGLRRGLRKRSRVIFSNNSDRKDAGAGAGSNDTEDATPKAKVPRKKHLRKASALEASASSDSDFESDVLAIVQVNHLPDTQKFLRTRKASKPVFTVPARKPDLPRVAGLKKECKIFARKKDAKSPRTARTGTRHSARLMPTFIDLDSDNEGGVHEPSPLQKNKPQTLVV